MRKLGITYLLLLLTSLSRSQIILNPKDFGLSLDKTGVENYNILYECHKKAKEIGANISYLGIDTILLDIPLKARTIPLTEQVDFAGATLKVRNNSQNHWLFDMVKSSKTTKITWEDIKKNDLKGINNAILIIKDAEPWVRERTGYGSGHIRQDLLYIKNGKIVNSPTYEYNALTSKPIIDICEIDDIEKQIKNVSIIRERDSEFMTRCFRIVKQDKVHLSNIVIKTPESPHYGDASIMMEECSNAVLDCINIDGTYSQTNKYGYGISFNNVWNVVCKKIVANGKWGVFGNNNVNKILLENCDINRFDIHCYGKDISFRKCTIRKLYNQFSSVYGTILFDSCIFDHAIPLLIESSYNAYTPFNVVWKNCTFYLDKKHNYIMTLFGVPEPYNTRQELRRKCLPNIAMQNCSVVLANDVDKWYLVETGGIKYKDSFDYITDITIKGLKVVNEGNRTFELFSEKVKTTNAVNTSIKRNK